MTDNIIELIISDIQNKNYTAAIERLDELISSNPANHDLYEIKAGCNYALGNYDKAVDDWTYAIINFKDAVEHKKELSVIYNKRGRTYLKTGNYLNASEDFNKSRTLFPGSADTLNNLATCMRRLKNYNEALIFANQAIELNPGFSEAYNNRGNINYCMWNVNEAYNDYSSAIEHDPNNAKAYFNRGSISFFLKEESNARTDWKKAISLDEGIKKELEELHPDFSLEEEKITVIQPEQEEITVIQPEQEEITVIQPEQHLESGFITEPVEDIQSVDKSQHEDETVSPEPEMPIETSVIPQEVPEILQEEPEILQEEPEILQEEPEILQEEPEIPQEKPDVSKEEPPVENYHDVFEEKLEGDISRVTEETKIQEDFEIPDINFKTIFQENYEEEVMEEQEDKPDIDKPIIPEEVQKLHEEIETPAGDSLEGFKGFTMDIDGEIDSRAEAFNRLTTEPETQPEIQPEAIPEKEELKYYYHDDEEQKAKNRLELIRSPVFLTVLILGILLVAFITVYQFIGTNKQETVSTSNPDSQTVKAEQKGDSLKDTKDTTSVAKEESESDKEEETGKTEETPEQETVKEETVKEETAPPVKETVKQESVSQTQGYISDKKKFLLISEKEGFFVQVGSYKEKSKAEEIAKGFTSKGIKAFVTEVDIKEKGIYYRVKTGAFSSVEEAKQKMSGLE
jgi:Flp pilus assembly protein TadD/cell division septation protein DedD